MTNEYGVFLGLDVGKSDHHAVALDPAGKRLHDAALPNTEAGLRKLFDKLAEHGRILAVVDQPASIGALPVAVARACGHQIAYLPGLVMRRLADLHPGTAKTDARDAYVIVDAARTLPHTLRRVDAGDDALAELEMLVGYDDDLAGEVTRLSNGIRGLLTQIHPPLERVLGPKVQHPAVLELLSRCGGPAGLRRAGRSKLAEIVKPRAPRMGARLVEQIFTALDAQTVVVPGTTAAESILPRLAEGLRELLKQRDQVAVQVEEMLDAQPGSCSKSATSPPSPPPATWPPTPDWPRSPDARAPASTASTHPRAATSSSNARSSCPRSPPFPTHSAGLTTTGNALRARNTTPPSSASPAAASTSCTPCSAPARPTSTNRQKNSPSLLDKNHRDTPRSRPGGAALR